MKSFEPRISDEPTPYASTGTPSASKARIRSAVKPPETTILTFPKPCASSSERTSRTRSAFTPGGASSPSVRASETSTSCSEVSSRIPHRSSPSASATSSAVCTESLTKSTSTVTFMSPREAVGELARGQRGVAAVRGDQAVRDGADAATAPPRRLGVGRHADRSGHVRRPAVAGLDEPVVVAGGEVQDRLAAGGLDHLVHVAHDERAAREAAEIDGLQVGEQAVVALDRQHGLPRRDRVALVQRADLELLEAVDPAAVGAAAAGRLLEHRDRLVDPAEHRLPALEHLHQHVRVAVVGLEQRLRVVEVGVGVVAVADLLDRQAEGRRGEPLSLGQRHGRAVSRCVH